MASPSSLTPIPILLQFFFPLLTKPPEPAGSFWEHTSLIGRKTGRLTADLHLSFLSSRLKHPFISPAFSDCWLQCHLHSCPQRNTNILFYNFSFPNSFLHNSPQLQHTFPRNPKSTPGKEAAGSLTKISTTPSTSPNPALQSFLSF